MKMVKSLLLGSAAGLVAVAGAQAADLPVKAKAVEYVKVCSLYGAGFYYIPGTDTCIKIGGYVRFEAYHNNVGAHVPYFGSTEAAYTRHTNTFQSRARGMLSMDVRSQTEYGTLRSYMRFGQQNTTVAGKAINMERAFIQFAGFTFGLTDSYFDFYNGAAYGFTPQFANSAVGPAGINVVAYTAQFGNGVSASLSLEDRNLRDKATVDMSAGTAVLGLFGAGFAAATSDSAGTRTPDIVGNIRVDQAWGSAQIMGALHEVRGRYFNGALAGTTCTALQLNTNACGAPGDEWGWAVGAGLTLKMPWDPKDTLSFQVAYAEGATAYTGQGLTNAYIHKSGGLSVVPVNDAIFANPGVAGAVGGQQELTESWSATASFEHYWTPTLRTAVTGQYIELDYNQNATTLICNGLAAGTVGGGIAAGTFRGACNPDGKIWQIASRTLWNPVANLDIGLEVAYTKIESGIQGTAVVTPGNGLANASPYALGDQEFWSANFRVQRNFWP